MQIEGEYRVLFTFFGIKVRINERVARETANIRTTRITFGSRGSLQEWFKAEDPEYKTGIRDRENDSGV